MGKRIGTKLWRKMSSETLVKCVKLRDPKYNNSGEMTNRKQTTPIGFWQSNDAVAA